MSNSKSIRNFNILMSLRASYKRLSQLSWTVSSTEKRFPPDNLTPQDEENLIETYLTLSTEVEDILRELDRVREDYQNADKT